MKKVNLTMLSVLLFSFMFVAASACNYTFNGIKGDGNVVKQEREVGSFSGIEVGGAFKVFLSQGDEEKVIVETNENLLDVIETKVVGNTLKISTTKDINKADELNIYITFVNIEDLEVSGACHLKSDNKIKLKELDLECSGASDVELMLSLTVLEMDCSGASQVELFGTADNVELDLSGASKLDAIEFETRKLDADISGASGGKMSVTGELTSDVSGASSFRYKGEPTIRNVDVSGAASFKKY